MILERETFEKYGYWPKNLSARSGKLIIKQCDKCGKRVEVSKDNASRAGRYCMPCGRSFASETRWRNYALKRSSEVNLSINNYLLCDIYLSGRLCYKTTKTARIRMERIKSLPNNGNRGLCVGETRKVLDFLKLSPKTATTEDLRKAIIDYLTSRDTAQVFNILNYILSNHLTLNICPRGGESRISDGRGLVEPIVSKLPITYKIAYYSNVKNIKITSGSFFINGKWIHIG